MSAFKSLYLGVEKALFFTLRRKIIGNLAFLFLFQLLPWGLLHHFSSTPGVDIQSYQGMLWITAAASLGCFVFTGFYMCYLIERPVKTLLNTLNGINQADADLSIRLPAFTYDEFRQLSKAYNEFADNLGTLLQGVYQTAEQAAQSNTQVLKSQQQTLSLSQQQDGLAQGITRQSQEVQGAIDEVEQSIKAINETNSEHVDAASESSQKLSQQVTKINAIAELINEFDGTIDQLQENSENIRNILQMVEGFSEQTNLLALNAAIEAARAGEAGRGFAVVADEVRSLSQKVSAATQQISGFIGDLDRLVHDSKSSSSLLTERTQQACSELDTTSEKFQQMVVSCQQSSDRLMAISSVVHQLATTYQENHRAVEQISDLSTSIETDMQSCAQQTQQLQQDTQRTQQQLQRFI